MTYQTLRYRILELLRTGWWSARELSIETGYSIEAVEKVLRELEGDHLVFRDGPLYIHRLGAG